MLLLVTALVLGALLLIPFLWNHYSRFARLTSGMPGPTPLPIIGNAKEFGNDAVEIHANTDRLWKKYGPIFRVWLGPKFFVLLSHPQAVEVVLNSNTQIRKNMSYRFLEPWLGTGLLTATGKKWHSRRKIITPTFHFKILEEFVDVFNSNGDILITKLKKNVNGPDFDIYNYINLCALDIICETAMGVNLNAQNNSTSEYVTAVHRASDIIVKRSFAPWLIPDFTFNLSQLGKEMKHCVEVLHSTTIKVIKKRREELLRERENESTEKPTANGSVHGQKKHMALLDLLLQCTEDGITLSDEDIREETDTFMFEGHDTTTSGIAFCLYLLSQHQDVQEKAMKEIKEVFGDSDRPASYRDLQELKYLDRVLKETLRMYPSVPMYARELDNDMEIGGYKIPAGSNIVVLGFWLNRNPVYFPDPEKFDPDRFLPENAQGRHPYAFVPFSAGPRNCIGQKFAMLEMKATVSKILRNFQLLPSSKPIVLSTELVLRSATGINLKLAPRQ